MTAPNTDRKLKKNDIILLAVVLGVAAVLFVSIWLLAPKGEVAVVTVDGEEFGAYDLLKDQEILLPEGHKLVIENGEARMVYAPCRDQICVHHIPVSRKGETIVCLPYRVVVTVSSRYRRGFYEASEA
ncbi:MAG: NusG domain II-containing protein [Clostridia bacterium]|nr:NusG domain II-containing protein [Clostridia bacterium]